MNTTQKRNTQKGFTLVEMLTVIAIIGILSSVAIVSYSGAREKARDSERVTEVGQIALALEQYYNACREYPDEPLALGASNGSCPSGVTLGSFLDSIPEDPTGGDYVYKVDASNDAFVIKATLEREDASLLNDTDGTVLGENCEDGADYYYCKKG